MLKHFERAQLFVAHPGHELAVHGWLARNRPFVNVLTDGSGYDCTPRLQLTADVIRDAGARAGAVFGALSDQEAYALILKGNAARLFTFVKALSAHFIEHSTTAVLVDAAEGYNPVHDLCPLIAGAAIEISQRNIALWEYAVVGAPGAYGGARGHVVHVVLRSDEYERKIAAARRYARVLPDVLTLFDYYGEHAYARESLRRVRDWAELPCGTPEYERFGLIRVASGRYDRLIRQHVHMLPLRDALGEWAARARCVY